MSRGSNYKTSPVFAIYVLLLVTRWLRYDVGGLETMLAINDRKAARLYETLDAPQDVVIVHADRP